MVKDEKKYEAFLNKVTVLNDSIIKVIIKELKTCKDESVQMASTVSVICGLLDNFLSSDNGGKNSKAVFSQVMDVFKSHGTVKHPPVKSLIVPVGKLPKLK